MTNGSASPVVRPVRWGIVGASDIADRVMAPAMRSTPAARLVAIASRTAEHGQAFATRHAVPRRFDSSAALAADPEVDAVYVATEVDRHRADVEAAAHGGKDVLVEKPIARSAAEGDAMVSACRAAGVRLGTCFYQRYNARHLRIRDLMGEGRIGAVSTVYMNFSGRSDERPAAWRQDPMRSGGGSYIDSASHCIDLLRFLFGEVQDVLALTATLAAAYGVEDTALSLLRLDNGTHAVVTANWSTTDPSDQRSSVIQVGGTDGTIASWPLHDKRSHGTLVLATATREETIPVPERSTHAALLEDFAAARMEGRPFPITGEDGVATQRVVDAVYESARTGRAVRP